MTGYVMRARNAIGQSTGNPGRVIAQNTESLLGIRKCGALALRKGNKMSKYGNKKWTSGGKVFDSRREGKRFQELCLMLRAGVITDLETQVQFELLPSQKRGGKVVERPVKYIADFVYKENGETVVEDAKGVRTKDYIIKRKLMLWQYGIQIREV